jgi:hypothetical protein
MRAQNAALRILDWLKKSAPGNMSSAQMHKEVPVKTYFMWAIRIQRSFSIPRFRAVVQIQHSSAKSQRS